MKNIDYLGKPIFLNKQADQAMWQDRNGKTHMLSLPEFAETLAVHRQILQAKRLAQALA